jgi:hypothetical protein
VEFLAGFDRLQASLLWPSLFHRWKSLCESLAWSKMLGSKSLRIPGANPIVNRYAEPLWLEVLPSVVVSLASWWLQLIDRIRVVVAILIVVASLCPYRSRPRSVCVRIAKACWLSLG